MLYVACVKVGSKYGADYVNILFDMVRRNLVAGFPGRFVCFTDDATGLDPAILVKPVRNELVERGWWAKLELFAEDAFPKGSRVLFFDLDTCIVGPLDAIASYEGPFAILRDVYRPKGLQSSVMAFEAGCHPEILQEWLIDQPEYPGGDQEWIERFVQPVILQEQFPGKFKSYKANHCRAEIPRGTAVIYFHGYPKPHEVTLGWVPEVWKVGGGSGVEFIVQSNVPDQTFREQVKYALSLNVHHVQKREAHKGVALIIGGGPSLAYTLHYIRGMRLAGGSIFATNNTAKYLAEHDIPTDAHVILDAREENLPFVPQDDSWKYYASQCHPKVLEAAGEKLVLWHAYQECTMDLLNGPLIGGGSSVGLRSMALAYLLGYRDIRLFGFDSAYRESHHAYPQKLNDGAREIQIKVAGNTYICAPWMISQAEEYKPLASELIAKGCDISVYGTGLIPDITANMRVATPAQIRASEVLARIKGASVGAEIGVFCGEMSQSLLARNDITLYMVDSWGDYDAGYTKTDDFHAICDRSEQEVFYASAVSKTAFAGERAKILRKRSVEAAREIPDASLDFVFIDADHSYEGCKADIEAWLPKIKAGGWICGHDYENEQFPKFGVKRAVDERFPAIEKGENYTWFRRVE